MKRLLSIVMGFVVALSALQAQNSVTIDNVDFVKGESAVMTVSLNNTTVFSAFQMDLTLPEGVEVAKAANGDKLDIALDDARKSGSHVVSYKAIGGNKVRIAAYSGNNDNLIGNSGALLRIALKATDTAIPSVYDASLSNVLFTTADENEVSLADASATIKLNYAVNSSVTDESKGSVNVTGNPIYGSQMVVTVTPIEHYELDKLTVNGQDVTTKVKNNVYTIASLTSSLNVVASFKPQKYTATFEIDGQLIERKTIEYGSAVVAPTAPAKEGHTFAGWSNLPAVMPGNHITIVGSYTVNKYTVTFKIDDKVVSSESLAYGSKIVAPAAPAKEGHTFNGWGDVAATVPAKDVTYTSSYTVNKYTVTFKIDDKVVSSESLAYGSKIVAPVAPAKEGHTFNGWGDVAATVPAKDVTYTSSYTVNKYTVTFKIDDKVVSSESLAYGSKIVAPVAPAKEGHTFNGWGDVAATVPAVDVTYTSSYTVNKYTVTFKIDDKVVSSESLAYGSKIVAPVAPAKEGHTFNGWGDVAVTVPAKDVTYTSSYTVNNYTVTFKVNGEVISSEKLPYGSKIVAPVAPAKEGHTFNGWGDVAVTVPAKDVTYTSSYTVNNYTVTFKVNGEVISSEKLPYGSKIVAPVAPAKEGHTFNGWGDVAATVPAKDVTYTSSYTVNNYTVTFKVNGEVISSEKLPYGSKIVAPVAPAKEGHTFNGWGDVAATVPAKDVTYTSSYTVNNYTVTFKVNGEVISSEKLPYGSKIVAPVAPAKEGHTFNGWGDVAATVPAKDVTYTGSYTVNQYTITFIADGVTVKTIQVAYNNSIIVPEAPKKEGHTFVRWDGVPALMPAKDVTVAAVYSVNSYTVTFKIGDEVIYSESLPYGSKIVAPEAPVIDGKTFSGWGKVAEVVPANNVVYEGRYITNPYEVIYYVDETVYHSEMVEFGSAIPLIDEPTKIGHTFSGWSEVPTTMPANVVKVYGTFEVNSYTVTFTVNGEVISSEKLPYGSKIVAPVAPAKEGHTFNGWGEVATTVPAEDVTYTGSYTVNQYTITFVADGITVKTMQVAYNNSVIVPEAPKKEGHTFVRWDGVPALMPAKDVTVAAVYTVNNYTVTFKVGDEVIYSESLPYGSKIVAPKAPEKEGHTFAGWEDVPSTVPAKNVQVYGAFNVNTYKVFYYVGEELVYTAEVAYGDVIPEYVYEPETEGDIFIGWVGDVYETMPAHDVTYTANIDTNIDELTIDDGELVIYDLSGRRVKDAENLKSGIYIVNGKKVMIK